MAISRIGKRKNFKSFFYLLILIGIIAAFHGWNADVLWGVSPIWKVTEGVAKSEVVQDDDDVILGSNKSNVLFLLDVGSTMTFTPTGTLPDRQSSEWTKKAAAKMLKDCTYGTGGLPLDGAGLSARDLKTFGSRYGRDLNSANNATYADTSLSLAAFMEKHINNYYFPFNTADHPLASLKSGSTGTPQPYALVFRNPSYWASPSGLTTSDFNDPDSTLVPNDSRLYKMKLVMWRLLEDSTLFEHLRVGMATTFQEQSGKLLADFYKYPNYGATKAFPNGTGPGWATGLSNESNAGGGYYQSSHAYTGVLRELYDYPKSKSTWAHINRAVLRAPIADYSTAHRDVFRTWIDGYENVAPSSSTHYYFENPELFADGKTYLSTALFPGHRKLDRNRLLTTEVGGCRGIVFSSKNDQVEASKMSGSTFNKFNKNSGEAIGTVLDFFSPPVASTPGVTEEAVNVRVAPPESFPIKDNCERNWVVVFTAGDDSQAGEYTAADAALKLFKETKNNTVTKLRSVDKTTGENLFEQVQLDDGIRTIVVGFVDPANTALRAKLIAMAAAGDPVWNGSDWVADPSKEPYFANNVPELMDALRAIMVRINSEIRPAKGPLTESASLEMTGNDAFDLFSASYRINNDDQWQGELSRYQGSINTSRDISITLPAKWELGRILLNDRTQEALGARKLVYWDEGAFRNLTYSTGSTPYGTREATLMGLREEDLATPSKYSGKLHPSRAMINWLHGYDYNYANTREVDRDFMLSDFGQSGVAMVSPPVKDTMGLPGYGGWIEIEGIKTRATRLFAQSNEGILHVINPLATGSGVEEMAILPPPVMQPFRLAATKFTVSQVGSDMKVDWNDNGYNSSTGVGYSSRPAYVLDGPLYLRDFDLNQSGTADGWGTYMIGMLGRAGNGLYVMDVTRPNNPKFLWFRETTYQADGRPVLISMSSSASEATYTQDTGTDMSSSGPVFSNPNDYPFYQMGYNMPRPVAGVAQFPDQSYRNVVALAGGFQENLDLDNNGTVGAVLYLLDPKNAYQTTVSAQGTKVFNSGSFTSVASQLRTGSSVTGADPYMGMLITPLAFWRSSLNKATLSKIFTADNRGNIFMVNFESGFGGAATPLTESNWSIQAVGSLRSRNGESGVDDNHCIPTGILVGSTRGASSVWVSGGTSNAGTRHNNNVNDNSALIRNKGQYIFAFKVDDTKVTYRNDLMQLVNDSDKLQSGGAGWYVKLQAGNRNYEEEYVTTRPVLMAGKIYCATFIPKRGSITCNSVVDGTSRIYSISLETGEGAWGHGVTERYIQIQGIKVAGLTRSTQGGAETIIMSYVVTNKSDSEDDLRELEAAGLVNRASGINLLTLGKGGGGAKVPFPPLSTYINYWREL